MNHIRKTLFLAGAIALAAALPAAAQVAGNYPTAVNGGINNLVAMTTNTYVMGAINGANANAQTCTVSEHPNVGLIINYVNAANGSGVGFTNGALALKLYRSYDQGNTFETTPFTNAVVTLPTAGGIGSTNEYLLDFYVPNADVLAIGSIGTSCAGGWATNLTLTWSLNSPRYLKQDASLFTPGGPTPSVTSTNWVP